MLRESQLWLPPTRTSSLLSSRDVGSARVAQSPLVHECSPHPTPTPLTMTSAKMSPAYSRSPSSPSALRASSSPGGAQGPRGLSGRLGEMLLPPGTPSGIEVLRGSGSRDTFGLCKGEGLGSRAWRGPSREAGTWLLYLTSILRAGVKPSARLFLLEWRTRDRCFKCAWAHAC